MGLNLSLRGHRIVPKSCKKDRVRISPGRSLQNFISLTRANSPMRAKQHSPVIMDLIDCLNLKSKHDQDAEDNSKKFKRDMVYKRPITLSSLSRAKVGQRRSLLQHEQEIAHEVRSDYIRYRLSSATKLNIQHFEESTSCAYESDQHNQSKEFICLGNKLNDNSLEPEKVPCTNAVGQTNSPDHSNHEVATFEDSKPVPFHKCKNIDSDISTIRAKIRKLPNSVKKSSANTSQVEESNNSHFYAVGLSLKAWRAKYNCILKAKKENFTAPVLACSKITHQKPRKKSPNPCSMKLDILKEKDVDKNSS